MSRRSGILVFVFILAGAILTSTMMEMESASLQFSTIGPKRKYKNGSEADRDARTRVRYQEVQEWTFSASENSTTNGRYFRSRSQMRYEFNSTVQFIFIMGLEGALQLVFRGVWQRCADVNFGGASGMFQVQGII